MCVCCAMLACVDSVPVLDVRADSSCMMGVRACALACERVHLCAWWECVVRGPSGGLGGGWECLVGD